MATDFVEYIPGLVSGAAVGEGLFVKLNAAGKVIPCGIVTDKPIGVCLKAVTEAEYIPQNRSPYSFLAFEENKTSTYNTLVVLRAQHMRRNKNFDILIRGIRFCQYNTKSKFSRTCGDNRFSKPIRRHNSSPSNSGSPSFCLLYTSPSPRD